MVFDGGSCYNTPMPTTLVIASSNCGKIAEIRAALAHLPLHLPSQRELDIEGSEEPYVTFLENALAKARHVAAASGKPALSDDSGLVVPALANAPGVHSARYAGADADDVKNNAKLLAAMQNIRERQAFYYAAMVLVRHAEDPAPIFAEGYWHGKIIDSPRGKNGFGYDPLFYDSRLGKTGGEMQIEEKQRVSHRGKSLRRLVRLLHQRRL